MKPASKALQLRLDRKQHEADSAGAGKVVYANDVMDTFPGSLMFEAGYQAALRRVELEAEVFKGMMKKRRYFNNMNGVGRFMEYLRSVGVESGD